MISLRRPVGKLARITTSGHYRQLHSMINGYLAVCHGETANFMNHGVRPFMDLRGKSTNYHPLEDFDCETNPWDNYFDQPTASQKELLFFEAIADSSVKPEPTNSLYLKFNAAYKEFLHIKPHILEKVNDFCQQYFTNDIVGIHVRGTDSFYDTTRPHPSLAFYRDLINEKFSDRKIFLSTDSQKTLDWMTQAFSNQVVYYPSDLVTFDKNQCNTAMACDPYKSGEDVLIESILLSRCQLLIRTISNVTAFSMILNPTMKSHIVDLAFYQPYHANCPDNYADQGYWKTYYDKTLEPSTMARHLEQSHVFENKKIELFTNGKIQQLDDFILEFYYG